LAHSWHGDPSKARVDLNKALELGYDPGEIEDALARLKKLEDGG